MNTNVPDYHQAQVLVFGDVMLDRYWQGPTSRISPEAPVPVVKIQDIENRAGGAGNVALNIATLGANAVLLGVTGNDENGRQLSGLLQQSGVACHFLEHPCHPTITKLRIISRQQQLIRLDFEEAFHSTDMSTLCATYDQQLSQAQVVILSDYGKGALSNPQRLIRAARQANVPVLVDPKGTDFERYRGASLITPNLSEFEAVVGPCPDDDTLVAKGRALIEAHDLDAILITRSEKGMTLIVKHQEPFHLPTRAREVFDVTGAGDTVISVLASSLAAGCDLRQATLMANTAAGIVVGKLGTATATTEELRIELRSENHQGAGMFDEDSLAIQVEEARSRGETLVMTNGCFDILHPGHVQYLKEAKALGDRLLVAVNADESVSRLKGPTRPINPIDHRMAVLAGLESVDWVVPFSEDTPERLICRLLPDILVKGGDYTVDQIAGGRCVQDNGGDVIILSFKDNCSTSAIVKRIQNSEESKS
ncbi:bifunctional D-glycero-beta-D-manno-heptose-7-phosphate kinase/D-glycero-beta-D-manno-heptose 1-phosphate adenylyltransferase HldE [Oceanobacter sp. 5_MG-2023]|uniref:bifunctional D-glycero-beta-D-manno-heptose-7-phosphate kinase/D-glycero-beta-D-manno-heptose 1-phosphate adenylyltransferase HldE n=1 Tax=Oceanobacter sp. 5_MG-2023 TaxID=3062645 RepID=UPI0026E1DA78|nr:bifunctional D-glycero-beta-D-manno-heptose-7-phosphate kinase/D-glycero-beta-D-manno-heptose 1-phosphate adenylyltransferase HldE [Oceanobacter sp. 5_MG-2023]MDO6680763.1 bifunctional D-glycero-beta-D-manno-heptose-7-phosphate kinase/D-glycero-beta-D-manno-heptose 1-phosphate adenylyltransferase HldE [Oceanobacter sp. 5_MG-2023]